MMRKFLKDKDNDFNRIIRDIFCIQTFVFTKKASDKIYRSLKVCFSTNLI